MNEIHGAIVSKGDVAIIRSLLVFISISFLVFPLGVGRSPEEGSWITGIDDIP